MEFLKKKLLGQKSMSLGQSWVSQKSLIPYLWIIHLPEAIGTSFYVYIHNSVTQ